ncbi:hypothetical protein [uncultured Roseibium sp.]|uniref:pyroglutamyl-peptidase I family protein n=1 Tax=uncultured Roseibium sp. TaxID=1936171 RepID=UPI0032165B65
MTIRLLVTGFTPFPGAPHNPTERLIRHFEANPPFVGSDVECRFAVLPVDYADTIPALEDVASTFEPHVAVHFGLAKTAVGFRLERLARNAIASDAPDNAGNIPEASPILRNADDIPSSLPLARIAEALEERGHTVEWSDNAGGYLCNYVFFHSAAGLCRGLAASVNGFVHVGPANAAEDFNKMVEGAETILEICVSEARGM